MSESGTNRFRYLIAYLLGEFEVGDEFEPSALHVTVLPWFALETNENAFTDWFYKHFEAQAAFDVCAGARKMFGPHKDVPVTILEPQTDFMKLHILALSWFGALGARWAERDPYVGDDFIAHVAQRRGYRLEPDEKLHIGSLILFKASRREDQLRTVAAKAVFNEQT